MRSLVRSRRNLAFAAPIAVLAIFPVTAVAHAELVRVIPADGETVTEPVTVVTGRYSEDLIGNSRLEVLDATGAVVATGGIDPNDARRMVVRPGPPLTDGAYTVESTAITDDGHGPERVTWTFTVAPAATQSPTTSPTPSSSPEGSPSAAPASAPPSALPSASPIASPAPTTSTSSGGDVLLPIIAALAIVVIGAGFLLSRNRSRP